MWKAIIIIMMIFLMDFEISNPTRRPDLLIVKKKKLSNCRICRPDGPPSENPRKRKERQILAPCRRNKKAKEHESDGDTKCNWN